MAKAKSRSHVLRDKFIGLLFLALTFIILFLPRFVDKPKINNTEPIKISSDLYSSKKTSNNPVRILIPNADIDLQVKDSMVVGGYWELSETTASYGLGSGIPGTLSNTVVFAHAREGLFYNLKDVKHNDTIYIFTKDKWYRYKVSKITNVYPNQVEVIQPTKNETLTLYTCSGFADEKRLIVQAVPQK